MYTLADVMTRGVFAVERGLRLREAATQMAERGVGAAIVLDGERLVVSEGSTDHAAALMIHGGFRHLPVVDGDQAVGIVSIRDLMRVTLSDTSPRGA